MTFTTNKYAKESQITIQFTRVFSYNDNVIQKYTYVNQALPNSYCHQTALFKMSMSNVEHFDCIQRLSNQQREV